MNTLLYYIFLYTPDPLLYFLISIVAYLRSIYRIVAYFKMEVELYEGTRNNCPVRMLWIGTDEMKDYILKILYNSRYRVTKLQSTNLVTLQKSIDRLSEQYDVLYIEQNSLLPPLGGFKRIKQYVIAKMRVKERNKKKYRKTERFLEENSVELKAFKINKNINLLRLFYDQLYVPHVTSKWGEHQVDSFDSMKRFYAKGVLQLAYHKGEAIAGGVSLCQRDTLVKCKYGVRNAKDRLHRVAASCYTSLKYAEEHNFVYFDDFHVKPFINDGLFRYKREWGLNVRIEKRYYYFDKDLYFKVVNYNPAVVDFLSKEPFIFVQDKNLVASLLCPGEVSSLIDEIDRQYHRACTGGIAQYELYIARELTDYEKREIYQRCGVSEEEHVLKFINYNTTV